MKDLLERFRDSHHEFQTNGEALNGYDPFILFEAWFEEAASGEKEANAFVLTTSNLDGQSSARVVYLKDILEQQFVFYSNYSSQKGREIDANPKVSMLFFWPDLSRQIRIEGVCSKTTETISDAYFTSRPRGSQIGAWASHQSDELSSREELTDRVAEFEQKFTTNVPRPPYWGGFQIKPERIEFWQGRTSRLHDRLVFSRSEGNWTVIRKNP